MSGRRAALLLSGGRSSRLGGRPKALLEVGGRSGIRRIAEIALAGGVDRVVAVVGPHAEQVASALDGLPVTICRAPRAALGRTGSVQDGLASVPDAEEIVLWPVDHPFAQAKTLAALGEAMASDPLGLWFLPTWNGHGGHPVLFRSSVRGRIDALAPDAPLRSLLPSLGPQVVRLPVDDPGVAENVDTPEAYAEARAAFAQREGIGWIDD